VGKDGRCRSSGAVSEEDDVDGSRFDAWTRRAIAVTGGGLATALLGLRPVAAATDSKRKRRKKRRRKRCTQLGSNCGPETKRKCCGTLVCGSFFGRRLCCKPEGSPCDEERNECCPQDLECVDGFCMPTQ
jgi:hypothetical protein